MDDREEILAEIRERLETVPMKALHFILGFLRAWNKDK